MTDNSQMSRFGNFLVWFFVALGSVCLVAAVVSLIGMITQNQIAVWEALKMATFPFIIGLACLWSAYFFKKRLTNGGG